MTPKQMRQAITSYCHTISNDPENPSNIEYLFNVLEKIGLLLMTQGAIEDDLLNTVIPLFSKLSPSGAYAPSFMDPAELDWQLERFIQAVKNLEDPPREPLHSNAVTAWEKNFENLIARGLNLLHSGLTVKAVETGRTNVWKSICDISAVSENWVAAWGRFLKVSGDYLNKLVSHPESFFILADEIVPILSTYPFWDDDNFKEFLFKLAQPRQEFVKHQYYRKLFSASEVKALFDKAREKYPESGLKVSLAYICEAAIAQETIKNFISNRCNLFYQDAGQNKMESASLLTHLETEPNSETPFILAGNRLFSLHLLSHGLFGWGVRKDKAAMSSLKREKSSFDGALFFSWKQYPNGAWVVTFDNYMSTTQFERLISRTDESFIRLDYRQVCDEDNREAFLEKAARAVLGLEKAANAVLEQAKEREWQFLHILMRQASENVQALILRTVLVQGVVLAAALRGVRQQFYERPQGDEDPAYYVPTANLTEKNFLDPNDNEAPEAVLGLINQAYEDEWHYIWSTVKLGQHIGKWQGPEPVTGDGFTLEIPEGVDSVWFLIGQQETMERVKNNQAQEEDRLYMVIYGPQN